MFRLGMKYYDINTDRMQYAYEIQTKSMAINTSQLRANNSLKLQEQQVNKDILSQGVELATSKQQADIALAQNNAGIYGSLGNEGVSIGADAYVKANEIAAKAPFDIKGAMYEAANSAIALSGQAEMYKRNEKFA